MLLGDATKAKQTLGWMPETVWRRLMREMVDADLERLKAREAHG